MKVYYDSGIRNKGKGLPGFPQKVNWQFEHAGLKRYIHTIYHFSKGMVFDIITILDEARLREYFDKYESPESRTTQLERRCAKQEHPYRDVLIFKLQINDEPVESSYSSSHYTYMPWTRNDDSDCMEAMLKKYSSVLKGASCFACERFYIPYPETDSKLEKLRRFLRFYKVKHMKFSTFPVQFLYPLDIHFEMSEYEKQKTVCFKHPITQVTHTLYFQDAEFVKIPLQPSGDSCAYVLKAAYEIEPALPQGERLEFNSTVQERLELDGTVQYEEQPEEKYAPASVSSIGIIGSADGPTSVFMATKGNTDKAAGGLHGLPLNYCFSVPVFKKENTIHFILEGINIKVYDIKEFEFKK